MERPSIKKGARLLLAAGLCLTLAMAVLYLFPTDLLIFLEYKVYDTFLRSAPHAAPTGEVVVVDLDERSLRRYGQWPWPRYRMAKLLERIKEMGAVSVGLDMTFAEPDRTSLAVLSREILEDYQVSIGFDNLPGGLLDNDRTLADVLASGPCVLGYKFEAERVTGCRDDCILHPLRAAWLRQGKGGERTPLFRAACAVCNIDPLARAAPSSGFINVIPDTDGILRRVPLVMEYGGKLYPSLTLASFLLAKGEGEILLETSPEGMQALWLGGRRIPTDVRGNLVVNYRGSRKSLPSVSAGAILSGAAPGGSLEGKIVILGTSAAGLVEIRSTPVDAAHSGPEIQATVIDNMIRGDPVSRPRWVRLAELMLVIFLGISSTLVLLRGRSLWCLPAFLLGAVLLWFGCARLMADRLIFASPVVPFLTMGGNLVVLTFLRFRMEETESKERTRRITLIQDAIIQSMAALAETRDNETGGHILRTKHYVRALAEALRRHPRFRDFLDDSTIDLLFRLAPLHDVGKVGVRDQILLKPARLSQEEFEEMKKHPLYGSRTIRLAERNLGEDSFLRLADELTLYHQEKWDGSGYPEGRKGEQIPIAGRLMAVADVYDALTTTRAYKSPLSHEEAVKVMMEGRGTHFDPDILDMFLSIQDEFRGIARRFSDAGT